ncbi:hypothetical protein TKK_0016877 [Trichogramma kaykai]|uniref:Carboxylic ester hydrolase n=1 Tax=Trichogramma kaykai TaxID=54128 RepID=A0ABD2W4B9_9HYME
MADVSLKEPTRKMTKVESKEEIAVTKYGKVKGIKKTAIDEFDFYAFKGIPYARPPVGELRFKDPEYPEAWEDVLDATMHRDACAQPNLMTKAFEGSEDCLYLNIYTRQYKSGDEPVEAKPVMVFIHGGAFLFGSGDDTIYGADYLLRKDIVLVTLNYRLGVLGFLNLEDEFAPGNQGLKDLVKALEWIRDNISTFGGNPKNVTIFGISAGGAAVHFLTLSPLANGLFHKAIMQSGCALNPWAYRKDDAARFVYKLCEILGHTELDHEGIMRFLRSVPAENLIQAQEKLISKEEKKRFYFPFVPGVDAKSSNPFMPIDVFEAAKKGVKVPLIIGSASREGLVLLEENLSCFKYNEIDYDHMNEHFDKYLNPVVEDYFNKKYRMNLRTLKKWYFDDALISAGNLGNFFDMVGDLYFMEGIHTVVGIQVQTNSKNTFMYEYAFDEGMSLVKSMSTYKTKGTCHGDEIVSLFRTYLLEQHGVPAHTKHSKPYAIMEQMVDLWTNFARLGEPNPATTSVLSNPWRPVMSDKILSYLKIDRISRVRSVINMERNYEVSGPVMAGYSPNSVDLDESVEADAPNPMDELIVADAEAAALEAEQAEAAAANEAAGVEVADAAEEADAAEGANAADGANAAADGADGVDGAGSSSADE